MQVIVLSLAHVAIPSGALVALYFVGHLGDFGSPNLYGIYTVWGSSGFMAITSLVPLISSYNNIALLIHIGCQISLSSIAAAVYTLWFFSLQHACSLRQAAIAGCDQCPCAQTDSCTPDDINQEASCVECSALSSEGCNLFTSVGVIHILLLVIGALFWACSMISASVNIALAFSKRYLIRKRVARDVALSLYVDHQTKLLAAGDRPTVTPSLLQSWVSELLMSPDVECQNSATLCRVSLQRRGYTMKVIRDWNGLWTSTEALKCLSETRQGTDDT